MTRRRKLRKGVIYGVVTPEDWDDGRSLTQVAIITDDYDKFEVHLDEVGRELLEYPYETVRVFGYLDTGASGNKIIRVVDFSPYEVDGGDDIWDDTL